MEPENKDRTEKHLQVDQREAYVKIGLAGLGASEEIADEVLKDLASQDRDVLASSSDLQHAAIVTSIGKAIRAVTYKNQAEALEEQAALIVDGIWSESLTDLQSAIDEMQKPLSIKLEEVRAEQKKLEQESIAAVNAIKVLADAGWKELIENTGATIQNVIDVEMKNVRAEKKQVWNGEIFHNTLKKQAEHIEKNSKPIQAGLIENKKLVNRLMMGLGLVGGLFIAQVIFTLGMIHG